MQKKFRIAILGIGGVGGFIGGKLAAAYSHSKEIEIIFIVRGSNAEAIKENGLKLITPTEELIVRPDLVADDINSIGDIDLLICCTKTYDLEKSVKALKSSISPHTLILPLLNGIDSTEKIQSIVPDSKVLQGCIYLVSKIIAPSTVQQRGEFYSVHFGGDKAFEAEYPKLIDLFSKANINAVYEENILQKIWSKFSFISPIATYTSAYNISIGKILESDEHTTYIKKLMEEILLLATSLNINMPSDTIEKNFQVMGRLPYETTSSMQADFTAHKPTELETLTGVVVRKASEAGIVLDSYSEMYKLLLGKL